MRCCLVPGVAAMIAVVPVGRAVAQDPAPAISFERFKQLRWVVGSWKGSGGGYAAFYETYTMVDDSTMRRYSWTDSTFRTANDSARFEWRVGRLSQVRGGRAYPAMKYTGDTVRWQPPGGGRGGTMWVRTSPNSWTAILEPRTEGGTTTVYTLVRLKR